MTYILLKLNTNLIKKVSQDDYTEMITSNAFIIFKLSLHYKTVNAEMITVFTKK